MESIRQDRWIDDRHNGPSSFPTARILLSNPTSGRRFQVSKKEAPGTIAATGLTWQEVRLDDPGSKENEQSGIENLGFRYGEAEWKRVGSRSRGCSVSFMKVFFD